MQALPPGWAWTTLGEIADLMRGVSYDKAESRRAPATGLLPVLRANSIDEDLKFDDLVFVPAERVADEQRVRAFDIVLAMSSGSKDLVGKAAQAKQDFAGGFGAFCGVVRPSAETERRYVGWFFQSPMYRREIAKSSSGIGINNLRRTHIEEMGFALPPLPEQRRIVAKVEELFSQLDAGVEELKKAKAQLKRYRQSVLKAAFSGDLTSEWRKKNLTTKTLRHKEGTKPETAQELLNRIREERKKALGKKYKEPQPLDTSELPELPKGWAWASLDELAAKITDGEHIRPDTVAEGVPFLSAKDVRDDGVSFGNPLFVSARDADTFRRRCDPDRGDILIVSRGATVGRTCAVNTDERFCLLGSVILIKLRRILDSSFARYALKSKESHRRLTALCGSTAQQAIYIRDIRALPLPVPPLAEQRQIAAEVEERLSIVDAEEKAIEAALAQAARLRQSILKRAFEGNLVPQDPSDPPASELLARIKAEKAKREASPTKRQRRSR